MKAENLSKLVIGQEVICSDGLGRVSKITDSFPYQHVKVKTYIGNRGCNWDACNIEATDIRTGEKL